MRRPETLFDDREFNPMTNRSSAVMKFGPSVPTYIGDRFKDVRSPPARSTYLEKLDSCPREFLYAYKLGLSPKGYSSPLAIGSTVHKVLECLFLGQTEEAALNVSERLFSAAQKVVLADANPAGLLPSGNSLESELRTMEEDYHKARAMALSFWRLAPFDTSEWDVLVDPEGKPMVEHLLHLEIPGLTTPLVAPCDLVLVKKKDPTKAWIVDYKTTSMSPIVRASTSRISSAMALYRLVLQSTLDEWSDVFETPKIKVEGSIHAILKKPTIKYCPGSKDSDGFHSYIDRMMTWYRKNAQDKPQDPPVVLEFTRFSGPVFSQELRGRLKRYDRASRAQPKLESFYRAGGSACMRFNSVCPFLRLCTSSPTTWGPLLDTYYDIAFREDEENE